MKLVMTVNVPKDMEREVKIADKIDGDWLTLRKIALSLMAPPDAHVDIQVQYPPMTRTEIQGR